MPGQKCGRALEKKKKLNIKINYEINYHRK
jgi:hypothetical protein